MFALYVMISPDTIQAARLSLAAFLFLGSVFIVDNDPHVVEYVPYPRCYLMALTSGPDQHDGRLSQMIGLGMCFALVLRRDDSDGAIHGDRRYNKRCI